MDSKKIMVGVVYLEGMDINPDGSLKPEVNKGKPAVVMVQGNFCPHCNTAKPAFQQLARQLPNVLVATAQTDGGEEDRKAVQLLSAVNKSPGVPAFLGFNKDGKFVKMHTGGRDLQSLLQFASSL